MPSLQSIPIVLHDYDFPLTWAIDVDLTSRKAETIIKSFNMMKTTRDKISKISHHLLKSFYLWYLQDSDKKYSTEAKRELDLANKLTREWEMELKIGNFEGFHQEYLDGVDYVVMGMKILLESSEGNYGEIEEMLNKMPNRPEGKMRAGLLHVKQEFFRPFVDEFDRRVEILEEIRRINSRDSRACLYLAKTLGQKRKMENFLSAPTQQEMDLLVQGNKTAPGDLSVLIELCYCLSQYIKNNKKLKYPLRFYHGAMTFRSEKLVADFINQETSKMWDEAHDAAPLYVKLAEIQSSLLPKQYQHPSISALQLVNRALQKYSTYSKALHRKAKILFKLKKGEEGIKCLEDAFKYSETNCDALCDLVFRLMKYSLEPRLIQIFKKYCSDRGEDLWGKRKVGSLYYLSGCFLWINNFKPEAIWYFLQAEKRNPNPTFYFENMNMHKANYRWFRASDLNYESIIETMRSTEPENWNNDDFFARDCLITKLRSLTEC